MTSIDVKQNKSIQLIVSLLAALGGLTAAIVYIETKKHRGLQKDILELDKNIKSLQLKRLQNGMV